MVFSKMIRSFGNNIYTGKININEAQMDQIYWLENLVEFESKSRPKQKKARIRNKILLIA